MTKKSLGSCHEVDERTSRCNSVTAGTFVKSGPDGWVEGGYEITPASDGPPNGN
jgi:hypothetical protein